MRVCNGEKRKGGKERERERPGEHRVYTSIRRGGKNISFPKKKRLFPVVFAVGASFISAWTLIMTFVVIEHYFNASISVDERGHGIPSRSLLGCTEIAQLKIVRELGRGKNKCAYLVQLPSGVHAVAKRCMGYYCMKDRMLQKEATLQRELQEQYGGQVTQYFGECDAPHLLTMSLRNYSESNRREVNKHVQQNNRTFSIGFTSVVELGNSLYPLISEVNIHDKNNIRNCFATHFTEADIDDFRKIARRYANFSHGNDPIRMSRSGTYADDSYPKQYTTGITGTTREGVIDHIDLDFLIYCKRKKSAARCTYEKVLDKNCRVMAELTNIPNLDCSVAASSSRTKPDSNATLTRINVTRAIMECSKTTQEFPTRSNGQDVSKIRSKQRRKSWISKMGQWFLGKEKEVK